MPYLHELEHIVTVGAVNTILFIGTPFAVTRWRSLSRVEGPDYSKIGDDLGPISSPFLSDGATL